MVGEAKAQLGLGHSYSRAKVKFNVNRTDNMIIQSIALLDQLDKDINTFSMRVKEWYSYHFPELMKIVGDNYMYCRLAKLLGNRKDMAEDILEKIEEITMDSGKSAAIVSASKMSMGMDVSPIDLINIMSFSSRVISLTEYRKSLVDYLHKRMASVAPNLSTLIGDVVGARLISHAGSLTSLAKYPASTVQILGAEKALFRALKNKGNTPKYGLIFHSTFIGRAGAKNKGRISRYLANKCSIASRIDCFTDHPNTVFGEKLRDQVENRLKFYESNGDETPMKNADVMKEAIEASNALISKEMEETKMDVTTEPEVAPKKKKKKKKSKPDVDSVEEIAPKVEDTSVLETPKSEKKKKKKDVDAVNDSVADDANLTKSEKKKKKKKNKEEAESVDTPHTNGGTEEAAVDTPKKKKKKMKSALDENGVSAVTPKKKKKTAYAE
jgi:RNA processing factor Prp31